MQRDCQAFLAILNRNRERIPRPAFGGTAGNLQYMGGPGADPGTQPLICRFKRFSPQVRQSVLLMTYSLYCCTARCAWDAKAAALNIMSLAADPACQRKRCPGKRKKRNRLKGCMMGKTMPHSAAKISLLKQIRSWYSF